MIQTYTLSGANASGFRRRAVHTGEDYGKVVQHAHTHAEPDAIPDVVGGFISPHGIVHAGAYSGAFHWALGEHLVRKTNPHLKAYSAADHLVHEQSHARFIHDLADSELSLEVHAGRGSAHDRRLRAHLVNILHQTKPEKVHLDVRYERSGPLPTNPRHPIPLLNPTHPLRQALAGRSVATLGYKEAIAALSSHTGGTPAPGTEHGYLRARLLSRAGIREAIDRTLHGTPPATIITDLLE